MSRNSLNTSEGKKKSGTSKMQLKSPKLSVCRSRKKTWKIKISEENFVLCKKVIVKRISSGIADFWEDFEKQKKMDF